MTATISLDLLNVDMFLEQKEKSDKVLLEIIRAQQAKIKELEELAGFRSAQKAKVSEAGLITPKDAAKYLGISEYQVREAAKKGYYHEIPWNGNVLYHINEINGYIQSCLKPKLKAM